MSNPIEYLTLHDLVELTALLMGKPEPIRELGLLGSAAARPQTTAFGVDAYPDIWTKAGALMQSIVKNHALIDGNKRLAWLATAVFLELNGVAVVEVANDDVYQLVLAAAAGNHSVDELAQQLEQVVSLAYGNV